MSVLRIGILVGLWSLVQGHGRLINPPSRSTMWRYGFKTPKNYNDHELFCGGLGVQWSQNGGKCGVCGDPWNIKPPRPNEAGGKYAKGIIVKKYTKGQVMNAEVQLTANHKGFFEFRLCPVNDPTKAATEECMAKHPIPLADGSGTRYYVKPGGPQSVNLKLPRDVTCSQCVFQWTYTAGNNWGRCKNGTQGVGCGNQETFRACADIAISDSGKDGNRVGTRKPSYTTRSYYVTSRKPTSKKHYTTRRYSTRFMPMRPIGPGFTKAPPAYGSNPKYTMVRRKYPLSSTVVMTRATSPPKVSRTKNPVPTTKKQPPKDLVKQSTSLKPLVTRTKKPAPPTGGGCKAVGAWASVPGMPEWCDNNCSRGFCPSSHCSC